MLTTTTQAPRLQKQSETKSSGNNDIETKIEYINTT